MIPKKNDFIGFKSNDTLRAELKVHADKAYEGNISMLLRSIVNNWLKNKKSSNSENTLPEFDQLERVQ